MFKTLTATFESEEALKNVKAEIVSAAIAGFPQEKIFLDKDKKEVKVIIPAAVESQIREIFKDHDAKNVTEREWKE